VCAGREVVLIKSQVLCVIRNARGAMVKALAICTTKPYIQIYKVSQSSWDICDTVRRDTVY
jgi:hypothetical protein